MCKYCEGSFVGETPPVEITNIGDDIEILIDGGHLYAYCQCWKKTVAKIKYCPMCGREL